MYRLPGRLPSLVDLVRRSVPALLRAGYAHDPSALTDASTVTPDLLARNVFTWLVEGTPRTLGFPSVIPGAGSWLIIATIDATGGYVISLDGTYKELSTSAGFVGTADTVNFIELISDGTSIWVNVQQDL